MNELIDGYSGWQQYMPAVIGRDQAMTDEDSTICCKIIMSNLSFYLMLVDAMSSEYYRDFSAALYLKYVWICGCYLTKYIWL